MTSQRDQPPKVFISYSHDSPEHMERVLALSERLRVEGIDCHLDQYAMSPPEGWPRWMIKQVENSDFVLVICTENYRRRFDGIEAQGVGIGAKWEGAVITQKIYELEAHNTKFIPVIFSPDDATYIPTVVRGATWYRLDTKDGYEKLYRYLTGQPSVAKPGLGRMRSLPPLNRKPLLVSRGGMPVAAEREEDVSRAASAPSNLVLLTSSEGTPSFLKSEEVEVGDTIKLTLLPEDSRDAAFLESLRGSGRAPVGVAFGSKAALARVVGVNLVRRDGEEKYLLELRPESTDYRGGSGLGELALGNYTPDQIAEMRARRILLNEKVPGPVGANDTTVTNLNDALLEAFIQGINTPVRIKQSPLPALYQATKSGAHDFLAYARLLAVLWLRLSGVVEHVYRLDLSMRSESELSVSFEGQRARTYSNEEPSIIRVDGVCLLTW